jgi:putative transposase
MIEERYEIVFLEIGVDNDHVHYLVQSIPATSPSRLVQMIKSLTARWIFEQVPGIKKKLWGGALWTSGYFIATVGRHGSETAISKYVRNQGQVEYRVIHQKSLFGDDGA